MWTLPLILILGLVGIGSALYGRGAFHELLVTWGLGVLAVTLVLAVGIVLTLKWPWIGFPFIIVGSLYVLSWMLKD